jgi:flagellar basal body-associated protein FliL
MTVVILIALVAVLSALGAAGYFMVKHSGTEDEASAATARSKSMVRALTIRIGVSVVLFLCILLAWYMGWIKPGGLPVSR